MTSQEQPQSAEWRKPDSNKSSQLFHDVRRNWSDLMEEEVMSVDQGLLLIIIGAPQSARAFKPKHIGHQAPRPPFFPA